MANPPKHDLITSHDNVITRHVGFERSDKRQPIVLLNGIGSSVEPWGSFVHELSDQTERPVMAVDITRAVGRCAVNPFLGPHMADYASKLHQTLQQHGVKRPDVLGFSWGSHLAAQYAVDHPSSVDRLVLAGGSPGAMIQSPSLEVLKMFSQPDRKDTLDAQGIKTLYGGRLGRKPELANELGIIRDIDPTIYKRQLGAIATSAVDLHNLWPRPRAPLAFRLAWLNRPTLIMAGTDDPITPYVNAKFLHSWMPASRLYTAEDDGHYFLLTDPEASAQAASSFLRQDNRLPSSLSDAA